MFKSVRHDPERIFHGALYSRTFGVVFRYPRHLRLLGGRPLLGNNRFPLLPDGSY